MKRKSLVTGIIFLIITVPLAIFLMRQAGDVQATWWPGDGYGSWLKRHQLDLTNESGNTLQTGTTIAITVNTRDMVASNQLRDDCNDLRIVYHPDSDTAVQLPRHLEYALNGTCATSEATKVYFGLQSSLSNSSTTNRYHLYYQNNQALAPSGQLQAFDVDTTSALLSCQFDDGNTCAGSETSTTDDGAIRYNGLKSALLFDGNDNYASAADSSSLSVTKDLTIEAWIKLKQLDTEQTIIAKWDEETGVDNRSYRLFVTDANQLAYSISNDGTSGTSTTITGTTNLRKGTWYHVSGVYNADSETIDIYLNGDSDATQISSVGSSIDNNSAPLTIASNANTSGSQDNFFFGIIDEVRVSDVVRYSSNFSVVSAPFTRDPHTRAIYHFSEAGFDPRQSSKAFDNSGHQNHLTITNAVYVTGFVGWDGPSVFGAHTGSNSSSFLIDNTTSWATNEWVGYIITNATDASSGIITANSANTITATLTGGTDNHWDTDDLYALSPDAGKQDRQSYGSHTGIFIEEGTVNKIDNPSFENTVYDTSWTEGAGAGVIVATTRVAANTSTGTQDITTSDLGGLTPKAVQVYLTGATTNATNTDEAVITYGAATSSTNRWSTSAYATHNNSTTNTGGNTTDDKLIRIADPSENNGQADFDSFITNGVRIDWTDAPSDAFLITAIFYAGDNLSAYADSITAPSSSASPVAITDPGFEPTLLFTSNGRVGAFSHGLVHNTGSSVIERNISNWWRNDRSTAENYLQVRNDSAISRIVASGLLWEIQTHDFDTNGFSVSTNAIGHEPAVSDIFAYLALEFDTDIDIWMDNHTTPTSTGNNSVTSPGFMPQFVFHIKSFAESLNTHYSNSNAGTFGFSAISNYNQYSLSNSSETGVSTTNTQSRSNNIAVDLPQEDGSTGITGEFVSFNSNGWTTDYTNVTGTGKQFISFGVSSLSFLNIAIETEDPYVKFGSRSAKIIASGGDTSLVNSVNPGNTNTHTLSFYAFRGTVSNHAGTIDNTVARVLWEGASQASTAYEYVGGGWWRLTYTATTANAENDFGVWIADGETLYVDGFQLEEKSYATTFSDGSLGTGYTWSGDVNESTSTRAAADLQYPNSGNIQASAGTASFWVKPQWDGDNGVEHTFIDTDTSSGNLRLYKSTGNVLTLTDGTNTATTSISGWEKSHWYHVVATWGSGDMQVHVNNSAGTAAGAFSAPTLGTNLYIGQDNSNGTHANSTIADLRIYDDVLTTNQITSLYSAGLVGFEPLYTVEAFDDAKGQSPLSIWRFNEGYGSTAHDSSGYDKHLTLSNTTWTVTSPLPQTQFRYLTFNGTSSYAVREFDRDYNFDTDSFTISGWFRHPSAASGTQIIASRYGTAGFKVYMNSSGHICFGIDDDSSWTPDDQVCTTNSYADSGWHHFSAVKDGTDAIHLYLDGRLVDSDTSLTTTGSLNTSSPLYLGVDSDGSSNHWDGDLNEIVIYPYARTSDQVLADLLGSQTGVLYGHVHGENTADGPVAYWKFDEGSGTSAFDSSGNNNTGTLINNPEWVPGKYGQALNFNGTSQEVTATITNPGDTNTISGWFYPTTSAASKTLVTSGRFTTNASSEPVYGSCVGDALSLDTWTHIAVVSDGSGSCAIYQDGVQTDSNTTGVDFGTSVNIAASSFEGIIDDVKIYNYALSLAQVNQDMSASHPDPDGDNTMVMGALSTESDGTTPSFSQDRAYCIPGDTTSCAPPVAHWKFDENTGTTANDSSGNDNHGTLINEPNWVPGKIGQALSFNGTSQEVTATITNPGDTNTISGWFYPTTSAASKTLITGSRLTTNASSQPVYGSCTGTALSLNTWHHITAVSSGSGSCIIYQNGIQTASNTTGVDFGTSVNIAASSFEGIIDDVRIYDYARTPAQVAWDYNRGAPVNWWRFDECSGTTAHDASGSGFNGTIIPGGTGQTAVGDCSTDANTMWYNGRNGRFNASLNFDGLSSYVDMGTSTDLNLQMPFTLSAWVNLAQLPSVASADFAVISKYATSSTNNFVWQLETNDQLAFFKHDGSSGEYASGGIQFTSADLGEWVHIMFTADINGNVSWYKNGNLVSQDSFTSATMNTGNTSNFMIGARNSGGGAGVGNFFDGQIDDVRIYNYVLTQHQIRDVINYGAVRLGN